mmetsp:Transcript_4928/g.9233  ORF Transcript_4928/g.9233 Transcript_4928/m.9233 type:complete len:486 (+) Transcript_4928:3106-4563(+)
MTDSIVQSTDTQAFAPTQISEMSYIEGSTQLPTYVSNADNPSTRRIESAGLETLQEEHKTPTESDNSRRYSNYAAAAREDLQAVDSDEIEEELGGDDKLEENPELSETVRVLTGKLDESTPPSRTGSAAQYLDHLHPTSEKPQIPSKYMRIPLWKWKGRDLTEVVTEKRIRVLTLTWNMCGKPCPDEITNLIPQDVKHHVYAIGTQECLRSIATSLIVQTKKQWEDRIASHLGEEYIMLRSHSQGATHLVVFVHNSVAGYVTDIDSADVVTGTGNMIGNKGGIAISFSLCDKSLLFVNCHLAAGQHSTRRRSQDFNRIERELPLPRNVREGTVSDRFSVVIWMGDFNSRVDGSREDVEFLIAHDIMMILQKNDQLNVERAAGNVAVSYNEGKIDFVPTYRFDPGTCTYDTSRKRRIPGWTDRILFRDNAGCLSQLTYSNILEVSESDHKPVFSQFLLKFDPEFKPANRAASYWSVSQKSSKCLIS